MCVWRGESVEGEGRLCGGGGKVMWRDEGGCVQRGEGGVCGGGGQGVWEGGGVCTCAEVGGGEVCVCNVCEDEGRGVI